MPLLLEPRSEEESMDPNLVLGKHLLQADIGGSNQGSDDSSQTSSSGPDSSDEEES
jgi:hypothetical protein